MLDFVIRILAHVLVPMFLVGMAGSAVVVMITVVHDLRDFFKDSGDSSQSADGLS